MFAKVHDGHPTSRLVPLSVPPPHQSALANILQEGMLLRGCWRIPAFHLAPRGLPSSQTHVAAAAAQHGTATGAWGSPEIRALSGCPCNQLLWCWSHSSSLIHRPPLLLDSWHFEFMNKRTTSNENNRGADGFFAADSPIRHLPSPCLVLTMLLCFS